MKTQFLTYLLLSTSLAYSQKVDDQQILRKQLNISKTEMTPKIDGILNDLAWENKPITSNFIERSPNNGKPQADSLKTEVKILYDNTGIYIAAQMYDPTPNKIAKELTERDAIGNDDFFGITFRIFGDSSRCTI